MIYQVLENLSESLRHPIGFHSIFQITYFAYALFG